MLNKGAQRNFNYKLLDDKQRKCILGSSKAVMCWHIYFSHSSASYQRTRPYTVHHNPPPTVFMFFNYTNKDNTINLCIICACCSTIKYLFYKKSNKKKNFSAAQGQTDNQREEKWGQNALYCLLLRGSRNILFRVQSAFHPSTTFHNLYWIILAEHNNGKFYIQQTATKKKGKLEQKLYFKS